MSCLAWIPQLPLQFLCIIIFIIHLEECVGQSKLRDALHALVSCKLWIQIEEDGHIHLLASAQALLLKAEALYFVEIHASLLGRNIVGGHSCTLTLSCDIEDDDTHDDT